ncbi:DNA adenine methylase [Clostridium sp. CF012]|uniref:DNA adenine methylase n=1 Tax=Clostridium sp. CF012 TaxID=2843319 RepID=UPI001C0D3FDA|nr:DNA adenine methylase [Clostridium sp. CF012]MBU3146619.1 DNA adenine methylase [Clostridium sp. CF012]
MKSPIIWMGGKSKLVNTIVPMIPEHKTYIEPFGGAGWILFGKEPTVSKLEVLNDFDCNLINFWDVVKNNHAELIKSFDYTLVSRKVFERYKEKYKLNNYKDNIERAHIFYYLLKAGFAGKMTGNSFGTGKGKLNGLRLDKLENDINNAYERLKNVTIENKSFEDLFRIYDGKQTYYFLDPPYRKTAQYPVGKFTDEQYSLLAECCKNMEGKFLLTINDDKFIRELFKDFIIIEHKVAYSISKNSKGRREFKELIIKNY